MKKIALKLSLFVIPIIIYIFVGIFVDAYNVFHVDDIRFTYATPNQNFIKTKYVLENKDTFNAFVLGSSRAGNFPEDYLPDKTESGKSLNWYNMTYAMGCVEENYMTVSTFIDNGIKVDALVLFLDEISMYRNKTEGLDNLIFTTYQTYEESPLKFYYSYIKQKPVLKLVPAVFENLSNKIHQEVNYLGQRNLFYSYGVDERNVDMSIGSGSEMFESEAVFEYTDSSRTIDALRNLKALCQSENIELYIVATPLLKTTYVNAVSKGYLEFLSDASKVVDFYCFSGLNCYTMNPDYYFDASHFRPYVGKEMEKVLFRTGKERDDALTAAENEYSLIKFGVKVTAENADEVIECLRNEMLKAS